MEILQMHILFLGNLEMIYFITYICLWYQIKVILLSL